MNKRRTITRTTVEEGFPGSGSWRTECQCSGCAVYKCCSCGHTWRSRPSKRPCPNCKHDRFVWVNYAEWCRVHDIRF